MSRSGRSKYVLSAGLAGGLLLLLLLWGPAQADTVGVEFTFVPSNVTTPQVYLLSDLSKPINAGEQLSWADGKLQVDLAAFKGKPAYFGFKATGYLDVVQMLQPQEVATVLQTKRWPRPVSFARSEIKKLVVSTSPRGAAIFTQSSGASGINFIGVADNPADLPAIVTKDYCDPTQGSELRPPRLALVLPVPKGKPGSWEELKAKSDYVRDFEEVNFWDNHPKNGDTSLIMWPDDDAEPIPLSSKNLWTTIRYYVRDNLLFVGTTVPVTLGAMIGLAITARRNQLIRRRVELRNAVLEKLAAEARETEDTAIGKLFGTWRVESMLGAGGMAIVYKAVPDALLHDPEQADKEAVALKIMNEDLSEEPEFRARFKREVEVCSKLNHPNIVRVVDFGDEGGRLYLGMELVDGRPMRDLVRAGGLSVTEAMKHFVPILQGLAYAHDQGVVHRDIKPDNIMVLADGRGIKIMDFGLARDQQVKTVTVSGSVLGTPAYVSPEQITGGGLNKSSDQYSLGITFYEILCGKRPFENPDSVALIYDHLSKTPMSMREWRPDLPVEVDRVVLKMLEKDPADRYPSLHEVLEALQEAATAAPSAPGPPGPRVEPSPSYNTNVASPT